MDEIVLVGSLALFLLLAAVCSIVFNKLKLPPLIGYLMAGIIMGNFWEVSETGDTVVSILSDMGLILLMFCIGMEINLKKIRKQGMFALEVALIQLPLMVLGGIVAGTFLGFNTTQCICLGAIISGSSTAVVMAVLKNQNRLDKEHIDTLVLITIMEDIGQVIILSLITPLLAGSELDSGGLAAMIVSIIAFMVASILVGLKFMPRIINWISDNVSPEIISITTVGLAFGMALLADYVGLSVAIGAFLMGMMISPSRKSKDISEDVEPMKNIFMAMFFISVGMEIGLSTILDNIGLVIIFYLIFAVLKISTVFLGYWVGNEDPRNGFISAVGLVAMGEFAFIIAKEALDYNVVDEAFYTSVVGAALVSMIMLPILTKNSAEIWDYAYGRCPDPILGKLRVVNDGRNRFYDELKTSSKKSRKEITHKLRGLYLLVLLIVLIEIVFVLGTPALSDWAFNYFKVSRVFWSAVILLANLFALYVPLYMLIASMRTMALLPDPKRPSRKSSRMRKILEANTTILAMMIGIVILIIIPNELGIWEHIIVLIIALIILYIYNNRSFERRQETSPEYMDDPYDIDTDTFKSVIRSKLDNERSDDSTQVSIDTKNNR